MNDNENVFLQTGTSLPAKNSPWAVASIGIACATLLSLFFAGLLFPLVYVHLLFPFAIFTGHIAIRQIDKNPQRFKGRSLALTGLFIGYFDGLLTVVVLYSIFSSG